MNLILLFLTMSFPLFSAISVGIAKTDITPPIGTYSAGYPERGPMVGVHDPLLAIALVIDTGEKKIAFCSVDHLGFTYEMVQKIAAQVPDYEIFIGSSHTHSGGGSYLNIPHFGKFLAGPYDPEIAQFYIDQTAQAIREASQNLAPAKIGVGYGQAENLSKYRGLWPVGIETLPDVTVIKVTTPDDKPLAVLFNYALHPTVLGKENRLFSADFVGYARDALGIPALFFNGAQGDVVPRERDSFASCARIGASLANTVKAIWDQTEVSDSLKIETRKLSYSFAPQATPFGLRLPVATYATEMNAIIFDDTHTFLTIPGELSCVYAHRLNVPILGLCNDAHGYIITPESWAHKTYEANLSFGGENYGAEIEEKAIKLLAK